MFPFAKRAADSVAAECPTEGGMFFSVHFEAFVYGFSLCNVARLAAVFKPVLNEIGFHRTPKTETRGACNAVANPYANPWKVGAQRAQRDPSNYQYNHKQLTLSSGACHG
jgi:hypothetical protein